MASNNIKEPNLFEILSLTPKSLEGQDPSTQAKAVKQAYRRALLKHHPDKNQQAKAKSKPAGSPIKKTEAQYTVDQITHAYTVLSDSKQRREYTRSLQSHTHTTSSKNDAQEDTRRQSFRTGVETVDLDDLEWDGDKGVYYRGCRCGNSRGYCFRELDLEEVGESGELLVECVGCSLWLRVLFQEVEDEDEENQQGRAVQTQENMREVHRSSGEGKSGGWSWKFNFGISIGGSATASATSGRS